ncbi:MAG TPA: 2-C-methyl-D-erythritol 2,4-cyclodiphosphate synthase [Candidatus Anoxymicrobiaceae bacterium]
MRTGIGVDAHRFVQGRTLFLGGVEVPHAAGLAGHSDADVVLHALMDALLGASGGGDIGEMFPDTDPLFQDISSLILLKRVMDVVRGRGYEVVNTDVAVMCEEPRIAPHAAAMCARMATALGVDDGAVAVKGTTTESMGFTGRGEGIMAIASVLLEETGE